MKIDAAFWAMFGAVGQWVAGMATVWAVWTALNSEKPRLKISMILRKTKYPGLPGSHNEATDISSFVINQKNIPVYLLEKGIITEGETGNFKEHHWEHEQFLLKHREELYELTAEMLWRGCSNARSNYALFTFYVIDYTGKVFSKSFLYSRKSGKILISGWRLLLYRLKYI